MPKYIGRIQFETMKVLRKRGGSIKNVAEAVGLSEGAVSRNLKYQTYEEYLASMYKRRTKYQKEVEEKSGPVRIVTPASKKCSCCGETKAISAFAVDKSLKDGHKGQCRKCINAKVRARRQRRRVALEMEERPALEHTEKHGEAKTADLVDWNFIAEELKKMVPPQKTEEPAEEPEPVSRGLESRVGEMVNAFMARKIRQVEIVGSREVSGFGYTEKRYLVRYKTWFSYKYADVSEKVLYED